jgi:hypothetical protein
MNTLGYYGVFLGLQYQNRVAMTERFDADQYDDSQTITIRIPLSVPYMADDLEFKRVDGAFEHNGQHYRMVKQKYEKDTLIVICVADIENKRISQALSDYVMSFTDNADDQNQGETTVSFIKDYLPQSFSIQTTSTGWQMAVVNNAYSDNLVPTFSASVIHPPERF